jgi:hypothetical protein
LKKKLQFIYLVLKGHFRKAFPINFDCQSLLQQRTYNLQKKPSASKENIQHFRAWNLVNLFLFLWVIFIILSPDPDSESGSGSTELTENQNQLRLWKRISIRNTVLNSATGRLRTGQAFFKESRGSVSAINHGSGSGMVKSWVIQFF